MVNFECVGFSKDNRKVLRNYLFKLIFFGRLDLYFFVFYFYFDQDFKGGEYVQLLVVIFVNLWGLKSKLDLFVLYCLYLEIRVYFWSFFYFQVLF